MQMFAFIAVGLTLCCCLPAAGADSEPRLDAKSPGWAVLREALVEEGWTPPDARELAKAAFVKDIGGDYDPVLTGPPGKVDLTESAFEAVVQEFVESGWSQAEAKARAEASWTISRDVFIKEANKAKAGDAGVDDECQGYEVDVYFCDYTEEPPVYKRRLGQFISSSCWDQRIAPCLPTILPSCDSPETLFYQVPLDPACSQFDSNTCIRFKLGGGVQPQFHDCDHFHAHEIECACLLTLGPSCPVEVTCCSSTNACWAEDGRPECEP